MLLLFHLPCYQLSIEICAAVWDNSSVYGCGSLCECFEGIPNFSASLRDTQLRLLYCVNGRVIQTTVVQFANSNYAILNAFFDWIDSIIAAADFFKRNVWVSSADESGDEESPR